MWHGDQELPSYDLHGLPVANGQETTLSRRPALTLASPSLLPEGLQIRLPWGVPIRLREEPEDLLARAGPAEAIAEVVVAEQPRDDLLRPQEVPGPVRRGDHQEQDV